MARRSFSGNKSDGLSDDDRKANVHSALGMSSRKDSTKYTIHLNETLDVIANKLYYNPDYWILLALKNNLSTQVDNDERPIAVLRRGMTLYLPDPIELDYFERNPDSPAVVALTISDDGVIMPLTRVCGFCQRQTLAMAADCVACGEFMDSFETEYEDDGEELSDEDEDEEEDEEEEKQVISKPIYNDDHQSTTIIRPNIPAPQANFAPAARQQNQEPNIFPPHKQDQTIISNIRPPDKQLDRTVAQNLQPSDPQSQTQIRRNDNMPQSPESAATEGDDIDEFWRAKHVPEYLDRTTRAFELQIEGETRGLSIVLQLQAQGEWITVYEYHVFPDQVQIVQFQRKAGRRRMKKSLPALQTKKMAWNHYRRNWQNICSEYWAT